VLVASGELYEKPVALFGTLPRATFAQASLTGTLRVMTVRLVAETSITVPLLGKNLDESGVVSDPSMSQATRSTLVAFAHAIGPVEPNGARRCSCASRRLRSRNGAIVSLDRIACHLDV
jgi:hypothetical protein